jgi:hypothetical protein
MGKMPDVERRHQIHRVIKEIVLAPLGLVEYRLECGHTKVATHDEGYSTARAMEHGSVWSRCRACEEEVHIEAVELGTTYEELIEHRR